MWCFVGVVWILAMAGFVLWIYFLVDVISREEDDFPEKNKKDQRLLWILVVGLGSWAGALVYYLMVYRVAGKAKKSK